MTEETCPPRRRATDPLLDEMRQDVCALQTGLTGVRGEIGHLQGGLIGLKQEMAENTKVTKEVRDILTTFKVLGSAAKWLAAIVGAIAAVLALVKGVRG